MIKPTAIGLLLLLLTSVSAWGQTPEQSAADMSPVGPPQLFQITVDCDKQRLHSIESQLTGDQRRIERYDYMLFLRFKDNALVTAAITGDKPLPEPVKQCIIKQYLASPSFQPPANGLVPIHVAFPVLITPKKHN